MTGLWVEPAECFLVVYVFEDCAGIGLDVGAFRSVFVPASAIQSSTQFHSGVDVILMRWMMKHEQSFSIRHEANAEQHTIEMYSRGLWSEEESCPSNATAYVSKEEQK